MSSVLEQWSNDTRPQYEAMELWKQAVGELPKLGRAPAEVVLKTIDRLLAEAPARLYKALAKVDVATWPQLREAFKRCTDFEAQLLLRLTEKDWPQGVEFVARFSSVTNGAGVMEKVIGAPVAAPVVKACAQLFERGFPRFYTLGVAATFTAVVKWGTAAQLAKLLALEPGPQDVAWLKPLAKFAKSKELERHLAPLTAGGLQMDHAGTEERFKRVHQPGKAAPPVAREVPKRSQEALFAAVYADPRADAPRAVLADFLLESDHPLGAFIQLQLARAGGRKGTLKKEKLLFENHRAQFWPVHPVVLSGGHLAFEDIDRGFPARFRVPGVAVPTIPAAARGHAGWSTVRHLHVAGLQPVAFLPKAMPLLEIIEDASLAQLAPLRAWPVRLVKQATIDSAHGLELPTLERLEVDAPGSAAAMAELTQTRLLQRLTSLRLTDQELTGTDPIALFLTLPRNIAVLEIFFMQWGTRALLTLKRGAKKPVVHFETDRHHLAAIEQFLRLLEPGVIESVTVTLSETGGFTKKTRAEAEKGVKQVLSRFA